MPPNSCLPPGDCPRCLHGTLIHVHAHEECPACRYVQPCCQPEAAVDLPAVTASPSAR
jgi:hypothetical protein